MSHLENDVVTLQKSRGYSGDITINIRDQSLVRRNITYNWYQCNGGRLVKMIHDNDRPKTIPQDLREWRLYEEGYDLLQGIHGAVQPVLDELGYACSRCWRCCETAYRIESSKLVGQLMYVDSDFLYSPH